MRNTNERDEDERRYQLGIAARGILGALAIGSILVLGTLAAKIDAGKTLEDKALSMPRIETVVGKKDTPYKTSSGEYRLNQGGK